MAKSLRTYELKGHSLATLFGIIENQPGEYRHLFRGQANAAWGLVPSLYRRENPNCGGASLEKRYDFFEQTAVDLFFEEGSPYLPPIQRSFSNDRILAQHFGVHTRLLDWSCDPLVATFFAVEDWKNECDAALFMISPDARYLPEQVASLGPHNVIALKPPAIDRRIPAQKSTFTFHPYGPADEPFVPLDEREDMGNIFVSGDERVRGFAKIVIPYRTKLRLFQTLLQLGIDRRNLFPGLDGVGAGIAARARIGQIW